MHVFDICRTVLSTLDSFCQPSRKVHFHSRLKMVIIQWLATFCSTCIVRAICTYHQIIKPHPTELIYFRKICLTLSSRCTQLWHAGQPLSTHQVGPLPDVWDQFPIWKTGNFHGKGHKQGQSQFTAHWRSETVALFVKQFLPSLIKKQFLPEVSLT